LAKSEDVAAMQRLAAETPPSCRQLIGEINAQEVQVVERMKARLAGEMNARRKAEDQANTERASREQAARDVANKEAAAREQTAKAEALKIAEEREAVARETDAKDAAARDALVRQQDALNHSWSALAVSKLTFGIVGFGSEVHVGLITGKGSADEAKEAALAKCRSSGDKSCALKGTPFNTGCISVLFFANGPGSKWSWMDGKTLDEADAAVQSWCATTKNLSGCRVQEHICAHPPP
jgi:hypothetical protein